MKKILVIVVLVLFSAMSYAQWLGTSPGNLYTTLPVGNVGIGTTTPTFLLHVVSPTSYAPIVAQGNVTALGADGPVGFFRMINTGVSPNETYNIAYRKLGGVFQCLQSASIAGSTVNISLFDYSVKSLTFGGNGLTNVVFSNSGYIGVGTTIAPPSGVKLAVNGKVNCKEVEVTLTGWSDFVFKPDYKLRSLDEVENFINTNKHLPDVPSEKEVTANGLNLGNMNATLLQKVEELTLYMIDLKKENDLLKARISKLEK